MKRLLVAGLLLASTALVHADANGERLTYVVGCISCHHQTPKDELNAPALLIVKQYSLPEFTRLLRTGHARGGRDLRAEGSLMGIVATEQFRYLTDDEIKAIYNFLSKDWSTERAAKEEAKIPLLYKPKAQ